MKELEDRKWFPEWLRRHQMDFLSVLAQRFKVYQPAFGFLTVYFNNHPTDEWTDVCSGSGGPVLSFIEKSGYDRPVLLTDIFPPEKTQFTYSKVQYHTVPVDFKSSLPPGNGLITIFNSFHHFSADEQKKILTRMKDAGRPFMAVEILNPGSISFLSVLFTTTIGHWILVPLMKPFSMRRLIFTYILPIHTFTVLFDGVLSVLKSKSSHYYYQLATLLSNHAYQFNFQKVSGRFGPLYILTGCTTKKK